MYSPFQLIKRYLKYYLSAANGKGHGTHSPFVYDFITNVLNDKRLFYAYEQIESIRKNLLTNDTVIPVEDYGAGSVVSKTKNRAVNEIAKSALKPKKFGQLLFRIVNYYAPKTILELGTSLGITSAYLATANTAALVTTMEGAPEIAALAQNNFKLLGLKNIGVVLGNFDDTLTPTLQQLTAVDLVFVDGNHRKVPTLQYFNQLLAHSHEHTILIFDDIHWSSEMEAAWEAIKADGRVKLTIDLFFIGLVFLRKDFKVKQHFTIQF